MHLQQIYKKASVTGAFFVYISLIWLPVHSYAAAPSCAADTSTTAATVSHVHDGDTVMLRDGRRVRLVGIDTPELARDDFPIQPYAIEARDYLRQLLSTSPGVQLLFDRERHDRHGRLLAHLFLPDGTSIQQQLLAAGYATSLVVPPNVAYLDCYRAAEQAARTAKARIWALARYTPTETTRLDPTSRGFHIIQGDIMRVGHSRKTIWLNLAGRVALRIDRKDLHYFDPDIEWQQAETLVKRRVLARGWLHFNSKRNELFMRIRHPAALKLFPRQALYPAADTTE